MRILYVSLVVVAIDQITKLIVKGVDISELGIQLKGMLLGESIPVISDVFRITYIENPNMAFGIELGGKVFLSVFALIASCALVMYLYRIRKDHFWVRFGIALILGGASGNLIDRIFYGVLYNYGPIFHGNVVDFFDFNLFTINLWNFHFKFWPIFNIADMAVSIGVVLMLLLYRPRHEHDEKTASDSAAAASVMESTAPTPLSSDPTSPPLV